MPYGDHATSTHRENICPSKLCFVTYTIGYTINLYRFTLIYPKAHLVPNGVESVNKHSEWEGHREWEEATQSQSCLISPAEEPQVGWCSDLVKWSART